mgnify:CR=1 FL=1
MSKVVSLGTKVYKPEILTCPFCNNKLIYKHTVSNKIIQFSSGKKFHIRNLGYGCEYCNDGKIYSSSTAVKMAFKGYTYSTRLIGSILYSKEIGLSRYNIASNLLKANIIISDRNVDNIYNHFKNYLNRDYDDVIQIEYNAMINEYGRICISIDMVGVSYKIGEGNLARIICVRNYFNNNIIGFYMLDFVDEKTDELEEKRILNKNLNNPKIKYVITIRRIFPFYRLIKQMLPNGANLLEFAKF